MSSQPPPVHSFDAIPPGRFVRLGKSAPFKLRPTSLKFRQRQSKPPRNNAGCDISPIRDARGSAHCGIEAFPRSRPQSSQTAIAASMP
jgi:hypothetical protein